MYFTVRLMDTELMSGNKNCFSLNYNYSTKDWEREGKKNKNKNVY